MMPMKPLHVVLSVCLVAVLAFTGCGSGINNATPEAAATSLVKAMIAGDSSAIDALNRSGPIDCPTTRLLEDATEWKMVGANIADYEIVDKRNLVFLVRNKKNGKEITRLRFAVVNGRYYFTGYDNTPSVPATM